MAKQNVEGMISIIIPVYNSGACLRECMESVVRQDYEKKEVLVVDDSSTDESPEILREYTQKYPFVHVFTKKRQGVSAARNYGLEQAQGEYVQFVDSDDRLEEGACTRLIQCMEQDGSDLVISGYWNEKEEKAVLPETELFQNRDAFMKKFPELFASFLIHVPWNKLYRRGKINASFPVDLSKGEDLLFNLQVLSGVQRVSLLGENLYFYHNINDNSLSFRFREDAMQIEEQLYTAVYRFYQQECPQGDREFLYHFYLTAVKNKFYALMGKSGFDKTTCKTYIRQWVQMSGVQQLYQQRACFGKKDRCLLFLMKWRRISMLYWYYQRE